MNENQQLLDRIFKIVEDSKPKKKPRKARTYTPEQTQVLRDRLKKGRERLKEIREKKKADKSQPQPTPSEEKPKEVEVKAEPVVAPSEPEPKPEPKPVEQVVTVIEEKPKIIFNNGLLFRKRYGI